jgi:hypothetical protein
VAKRANSDFDEHIMLVQIFTRSWYFVDLVRFLELLFVNSGDDMRDGGVKSEE